MATHTNRRTGFTLIELLVVIALIATLAAITAGAFMRVRAGQTKAASEATLQKLGSALENRRTAIIQSVKEDAEKNQGQWPNALAMANGNPELAKSLLLYAKMKNELPMSFAEAKAPTVLKFNAADTIFIVLPARASFGALPVSAASSEEQSAICFYLAVSTSAGGGAMLDSEGLQFQTTDSAAFPGFKVFKDAWGSPIAFVRQVYTPEVNVAPYIKAGQLKDPFDPGSKLSAVMTPYLWQCMTINMPAVAGVPATYPAPVQNFVATLVSAGPDKVFTTGTYNLFGGVNNDNLLSDRLRRDGAKGD